MKSKEMVIVGSDCISLYPNLTKLESGEEIAAAVMDSDIVWTGIDWKEATRYLVLGRSREWCFRHKLRRVLPIRRSTRGTKPGMTGQGPLGADVGDEKQWVFPKVEITKLEKKLIISEVLRLGVETMFDTHMYTFGGRIFKQSEGGPIGLRSTCAVARVIMNRWDAKWKDKLKINNIELESDARYVDDGRAVLFSLRPGWRWLKGGLWFRKDWESEDKELTGLERTKKALHGSMQGLTSCLAFTVETSDEFEDGWLPTLDMKLRITSRNTIQYSFFEKPTCSKLCLQSNTALNQNCMIQSLTNEVIRRLKNISESVPWTERIRVLDEFTQKMVNSGHSTPTIWKVLVGGIKGYERDVQRCKQTGNPLNRSAAYSARSRKRKKLLAKCNWFRESGKNDENLPSGWKQDQDDSHQEGIRTDTGIELIEFGGNKHKPKSRGEGQQRKSKHGDEKGLHGWKARSSQKISKKYRTSTVLFIEYSHDGGLQKTMRGVVEKLAPMLGFTVRISERGGTPLSSLLSNKNLWGGQPCGRGWGECHPCHQETEMKEPGTMRNIV